MSDSVHMFSTVVKNDCIYVVKNVTNNLIRNLIKVPLFLIIAVRKRQYTGKEKM
jgi:hypothetical protein